MLCFAPLNIDRSKVLSNKTNIRRCTFATPMQACEHCEAVFELQAAEKVAVGSPVAGRAYFVTNDDAQPFWGFIGDVLEPLGYGRPHIKLPFALIFAIACVFEFVVRLATVIPAVQLRTRCTHIEHCVLLSHLCAVIGALNG